MNFIKCALTKGLNFPPDAEYKINEPKINKINKIENMNQLIFFIWEK